MRIKALFILAAGFFVIFSSCSNDTSSIIPSDTITTETRTVRDFYGIEASTTFKVYVTMSDSVESVEIRANDNLQRYVEAEEQGGSLVLKLADGVDVSGGNMVLEAYVTTKDISEFYVSEASGIYLQNALSSSELTIDLSEVSSFAGEIHTTSLECNLSDASVTNLSGTATTLNLDISDASSFSDYNLAADYLYADISEASNAYITVNKSFTASLSDASNLYYKGNGVNDNSDTSGASNIIKVD